jgi:hypothetical protein
VLRIHRRDEAKIRYLDHKHGGNRLERKTILSIEIHCPPLSISSNFWVNFRGASIQYGFKTKMSQVQDSTNTILNDIVVDFSLPTSSLPRECVGI